MTILASLVNAYDRLSDAPPIGYSSEKIGFVVSLNEDGSVASVSDLREGEGKRMRARQMLVPQPVKRTAGVAPNFLWDKTSYVLGVTAGEGKRTADEHAAFVERHLTDIGGTDDAGLRALLSFLQSWTPERFGEPVWPEDMKDQNVIFALESDRLAHIYIHDRPAAKALWARLSTAGDGGEQICLVTGDKMPPTRLHPSIKGVWGAQSSGAALVSFNLDAFTSYGHEQGANAPVSENAAFKYTTVLNRFLERDSGHRVQVGDASTVFWADSANMKRAEEAESLFSMFLEPPGEETGGTADDDKAETRKIEVTLKRIREGQSLASIKPDLVEGVRFYVLGLSPNAARLSVRFFFSDTFGALTGNYQRYLADVRVEPPPKDGFAPLWRYLQETAVLGKRENVQPNLAGEWMRAILSGTHYPLSLMAAVLTRIRADGNVNALRVGILKALLIRNFNMKEVPVALDPENGDRGYLLGRLFAVYEEMQRAALGGRVNATIRDKFYGSASAQPRKVFAVLENNSANHLAKVRKTSPGREYNLKKLQDEIMDRMNPNDDPYPSSLRAQEQALFGLGYHHQHSNFFKPKSDEATIQGGVEE
ncbi:type I-C CRISPR-associated protein Cas8c/Csd1 [Martelella sp. AD-3]|uniref:type I-C CRISPR-associated protein Cas8c/Csd1 n=1 Tax=Martelella sp. AD-3 TaxID=686597 RepID=UPI0004672B2A|nr:type I-C CRISPR-associated protein Cas8c/Csd1 [Martelella sp. AD-3]AMM84767.1 type I-C CRISPR-associated protein Cas8c/Csd1 [Martelella sp. AD-3]